MKQKTGDKATLRWVTAAAKGKKRYVGILLLSNMVLGGSSMGYALFLSGLVDGAMAHDVQGFLRYALALILLVLGQFALRTFYRFLEEYTRASLENSYKQRLFGCLLTGDYAAVTATHSGEWLNRMTSDTVVVADAVTQILPGIAGTLARMISAVVLLIAIAPGFGWAFVIGGPLVIVLTWAFRKLMKRLHRQVQLADGALRVFLTEHLGSLMILRAFGQQETAMEQGVEKMQEHRQARMKKNRLSNLFQNSFGIVMNCVYVFGAVYCGYGILNGTMSYGSFTAVLQLVSQTNAPIANISAYFPKYSAMLASAERLMEAECYPQEQVTPARADMPQFYRQELESIGLRDVCFTYQSVGEGESRRRVLKDLNLQIQKGEYVAFCGPSGCGKSTVLKLLMSMYPLDSGEVYVSAGEEIKLDAGWRGLFAYVPQGNQLMSGTIRQVVTFGEKDAESKDDQIRQALAVACAQQFVDELPGGLDTLLGERGAGLSEGQLQRIAIARAIYSQRPVLLLDEATSALDEATEAKVLDNLRSMTDKTVIIVTHRPKALEITDKIIHFEPNDK